MAVGAAPLVSGGVTLAAGMRYDRYSLDVEGRFDFTTRKSYAEGTGETALRILDLVPCVHFGPVVGCALGGAGVLSADGSDLMSAQHGSALYASVGVRGGVELPIAPHVAIRGLVDVQAPLTRTTLTIGTTDVWTTPPVNLALGIGILGHFP